MENKLPDKLPRKEDFLIDTKDARIHSISDEPVAGEPAMDMNAKPVEMVNHPSHYNDSEIETFEMFILMHANQPEMIKGALLFNIFKYRDRAKLKGKHGEDVKKMHWYLDKQTLLFPEDTHLYEIYHQTKAGE